MGEFVEVARTGDLQAGMMKKVNAGGRELLLARTAGDIYCADDRCPHLNGDLSRGTLAGTVVTCPDHKASSTWPPAPCCAGRTSPGRGTSGSASPSPETARGL